MRVKTNHKYGLSFLKFILQNDRDINIYGTRFFKKPIVRAFQQLQYLITEFIIKIN